MTSALLLDRDGVLIAEEGHQYSPASIATLPGVVEGLGRFRDAGYIFFIVSNQSGIGRGLTTEREVEACNAKLVSLLQEEGIIITDTAYCPHHPDDHCGCRKPKTGMWNLLSARHGLKPESCIMVGNRESDIVFGRNIGCRTALIGPAPSSISPDYTAHDLPTLADLLLAS